MKAQPKKVKTTWDKKKDKPPKSEKKIAEERHKKNLEAKGRALGREGPYPYVGAIITLLSWRADGIIVTQTKTMAHVLKLRPGHSMLVQEVQKNDRKMPSPKWVPLDQQSRMWE